MKDVCPDGLLAHFDESSATYEKYVEHLNGCKRCRLRADESFAQDDSAIEFSRLLRDTTQNDLVLEEYQSTISLQFSLQDDSRLEIEGDEFHAGTPNLDFLPSPSHPELLGRLGRYDIDYQGRRIRIRISIRSSWAARYVHCQTISALDRS